MDVPHIHPHHLWSPPVLQWLYRSRSAGVIWLAVRVALGVGWFLAAWPKIFGAERAAWMAGGIAVKGFVDSAAAASRDPEHPQVAYTWYVSFLRFVGEHAATFAKVVAIAELLIAVGLVIGGFTAFAALAGLILNFLFVLGGVAGSNPIFILAGVFLVAAWRNAGWFGVDRYLLPLVGTPWQPHHRRAASRMAPD